MSDNQNFSTFSDRNISNELHVCLVSEDREFIALIEKCLDRETYQLTAISNRESAIELVKNQREKIDCLLILKEIAIFELLEQLQHLGIVLPIAIAYREKDFVDEELIVYHTAEVKFKLTDSESISERINLALAKFLNLSPLAPIEDYLAQKPKDRENSTHNSLISQQHRLAEKLKERLGYLGVYYQRNYQDFYRNLNDYQQKELSKQLTTEYRQIILSYFEDDPNINQIIDRFVHQAFFADLSVSQILEIHMELMDEFSQQLKLEGRSEEILLDYRLALIDIIAHLCEMYRRCIPKEEITPDSFFKID